MSILRGFVVSLTVCGAAAGAIGCGGRPATDRDGLSVTLDGNQELLRQWNVRIVESSAPESVATVNGVVEPTFDRKSLLVRVSVTPPQKGSRLYLLHACGADVVPDAPVLALLGREEALLPEYLSDTEDEAPMLWAMRSTERMDESSRVVWRYRHDPEGCGWRRSIVFEAAGERLLNVLYRVPLDAEKFSLTMR